MAQIDIAAPSRAAMQYKARLALTLADIDRALAMRARLFRGGKLRDEDPLDTSCRHVLLEDGEGRLVCCLRLLDLQSGAEITRSYAAQHYDLTGLSRFPGPMIELGRFCIEPDARDPAILRVVWSYLAKLIEQARVQFLFGCSSFQGAAPAPYRDAFALLKHAHLGPEHWRPGIKSPEVFEFARELPACDPDPLAGLRTMPSLLRSYLSMGGWVSDHAVIDADLGTLHVFTGLEIARISPARRRFLQGSAA